MTYYTYPWIDVDRQTVLINEMLKNNNIAGEKESDRYLREQVLAFIKENPSLAAYFAIKKLGALYSPIPSFFGSGEIVKDGNQYSIDNFMWNDTKLVLIQGLPGSILIFGFLGFLFFCIRKSPVNNYKITYIYIFIGLLTILHLITFAETRFRIRWILYSVYSRLTFTLPFCKNALI